MTSHPDPAPSPAAPGRDATEVTSGRMLRNTLVNGFGSIVSAALTAALTPFLLHRLGAAQYGVWLLALSLTFTNGYLALADLGLTEASVKFIAEARAARSKELVDEIASTTTAVFGAIGVAAALVVAGIAPSLVELFGVRDELGTVARSVFRLMALEIGLGLPTAGLLAVVEGAQRYVSLRVLDLGARLSLAVVTVTVLLSGGGLVSLALGSLGVATARLVGAAVVAHRAQPGLRLRVGNVTRATLRRTLGYGSFVGGLRVLSVIYSQMDRAIIAVVISVAAVARYEIPFRIQSLATLALVMASSAVLPAAAYNAARRDHDRQQELYLRGTKYAIAMVVPVTMAAMLFARGLIRVWIGDESTGLAGETRLFLVFPLFSCVNQVGVTMLIGLGRIRRVLALQIVAVVTNLVVSVLLAPSFGIAGVILGSLVGGVLVWPAYVHTLLQTFDIRLRTWMRRAIVPNAPAAAAQLAVGIALLRLLGSADQPIAVIGAAGTSVVASALVFVAVGLTGEERRHLLDRVRRG